MSRARWLLPVALAAGCGLDRGLPDADLDGYAPPADCDDGDPGVHPDATEVCDGVDQDCDGEVDEDAVDRRPFWVDGDGDGFGSDEEGWWGCAPPEGMAGNADDCDDADPGVHPGATEVCDGVDQDCDGEPDEGVGDSAPWYADTDGDGFGDPAVATLTCEEASVGYVRDATDCDDLGPDAAETFPGAAEHESTAVCMQDADEDGWGDAAPALATVTPGLDCDDLGPRARFTYPGSAALEGPADCTLDLDGDGWGADLPDVHAVVPGRDCDDDSLDNRWTFPGAAELESGSACMRDRDEDGWGDASPPEPRVTPGTDCDDGDAALRPDAPEDCDGVDQDCDGLVDDGAFATVFPDADGDGYGDAAAGLEVCMPPSGWLLVGDDCDDTDPEVHPGATEWCDGRDNDCDGLVDDAVTWIHVFPDADGDGWGETAGLTSDCWARPGYVIADGDCDDGDAAAWPGAPEIACDGIDQDCDGTVETCERLDTVPAWTGEIRRDLAGAAVAGAGDVDGDGLDDLLIGAPGSSASATLGGAAYLVLGAPSPLGGSLLDADARFTGAYAAMQAGTAVAGVGDVNGDGFEDLAIGAPYATCYAYQGGEVDLVLGGATPVDVDLALADAAWGGTGRGDLAGFSVAGAGDVDGDGLDDLLIGVPFDDGGGTDAGAACLVLGAATPASGPLSGADACYCAGTAGDVAGVAVAGAGDVDGDGLSDVLIGAPDGGSIDGMIYLVLGRATPADLALADADAAFISLAGDSAGAALAMAGDVDGDGLCDLLIGA
ncbi:MAG: MopE-related protein, partial [Pseudomonadota bacterium]